MTSLQQRNRPRIVFPVKIFVECQFEERLFGNGEMKQGHAGMEFPVVGIAEDPGDIAVLGLDDEFGALAQSLAELRVLGITARFIEGMERESLGHVAVAETHELWENEPHPMRLLFTRR